MLNVLPPEARGFKDWASAFLVGEPTDHEGTDWANDWNGIPRFRCYVKEKTEYYDLWVMTVYEFDDKFNFYDLNRLTDIKAFDFKFSDEVDREIWTGFHMDLGRYRFDWRLKSRHWRYQMDNKQDASYFGEWINILKLIVVSYVEWDIYISQYKSRPQMAHRIKTDENFRGIDWWLNSAHQMIVDDFLWAYAIENYKK